MKLNKRQKIIGGIALGMIVVFVFERFFLSEMRERLNKVSQQIKVAELKLKKELAIKKDKANIVAEYTAVEPYLSMVGSSEQQIIAELLSGIESMVRESGGSVASLTPQDKPQEAKGYKKYKADFRLEASFVQMVKFLKQIQESKSLIKIDSIVVDFRGEDASILRVSGIASMAIPN